MSILAIDGRHPEEIRVAALGKEHVSNLYVENSLKKSSLKDIYAGVVRSIEPSLSAVFVEYGPGRHGFLPFKEIASEYYQGRNRHSIQTSLRIGQSIIVQIKKEEREDKGAALTTYITLPGIYLVLMPNHSSAGGVSKQIAHDIRKDMQDVVDQLKPPMSMSVILRTAGAGRAIADLQKDLVLLLKQWDEIKQAFQSRKAPFLIFQEGDILARAIRDYVREDVTEIIVNDTRIFEKMRDYARRIRPDLLNTIRLYEGRMPLFLHLGIEEEVELAFQHAVRLPSGGSIIFDRAVGGIVIDVNSGSSTKHGDITETALKTNLEAAEMIARQLRLRDLGGLIFIDFIGMREDAHKKQVEAKLWESTSGDRARIQIGHILPRFDVLVMSRQRLRSSLGRVNEDSCPACQGRGIRRSIESLALSIIRTVEKKLFLKKISQIRIEASLELITYLGNEKRTIIYALEQEHTFKLLLLPNLYWEAAQFKITTFVGDEVAVGEVPQARESYALLSDTANKAKMSVILTPNEIPAVERFANKSSDIPSNSKLGFVKTLFNKIMPWKRNSEAVPTQPILVTKPFSKVPRTVSPASKMKKLPRLSIMGHQQNRQRGVDSIEKIDKQSVNKPNILLESTAEKTQLKKTIYKPSVSSDLDNATLEASLNRTAKAPLNNTQASQRSFKRPVVHRYGGEPRIQKRGYS